MKAFFMKLLGLTCRECGKELHYVNEAATYRWYRCGNGHWTLK